MTSSRQSQISLEDTKYYHCMSRCVRRAYLCGYDAYSGRCYEHRREWVETKMIYLASVFCIDICAYAVMSNHLHLVVHIDDEKAQKLTDEEVLLRWHKLQKPKAITEQYLHGEELNKGQLKLLESLIVNYRERLFNISWFMKMLNESISRRANKEDNCTGRFWEGRFKSQALLDESALAACMAYVDLNPVRAKVSKTLEKSDFTSIQQRIIAAKKGEQPKTLLPFYASETQAKCKTLPFRLESYIELVELTGCAIRCDKRGYLEGGEQILSKIKIAPANWLTLTKKFSKIFHGAVGKEENIDTYCEHSNRHRRSNITSSRQYLS